MPVDTPSTEYTEALPDWQVVRDCRTGRRAILAGGDKYLPTLPGNKEGYKAYQGRANFYNAVRRTVQGLVGLIFQEAPRVEKADRIKTVLDDVTPRGHVPFDQFAQEMTREILTTGRVGVIVDMAKAEEAAEGTAARPYAAQYKAEDCISWRTGRRGADDVLTRVVLRECAQVADPKDPFVTKDVETYRVLELTDEGYTSTVWAREGGKGEWKAGPVVIPVRRGKALDFIPFLFVGPAGVGPDVQAPPLLDLAEVNVAHYRNSADYEYGLHIVALPTPYVTGTALPEGPMPIGPANVWKLTGEHASAGMLEFTGAGLAAIKDAMAEKKREMATLGARLLEEHQTEGNETATAARMRHTGEHATLKTVAQSIEQALLQIVQWLAWWDGEGETPADVKSTVELHKEFFQIRATPDEVRALLEAWNDGAISFQTLFEGLQKGGWTREGATADEEKALVDGEKDERMKRAQEMMNATARTRMEAAVPPGDDPDDEPPPKPAVQRKAA